MDVRIAFDAGNFLGETPIWSPEEQALWWVNCEHPPELHRWHPESGEHRVWPMPSRIGGQVPKADGGRLLALADGIYDFDPASGRIDPRAPNPFPPHVKLHECHCDRQGRFWVGGYDQRFLVERQARDGAICRLDGDRLTLLVPEIGVANGMAFSPDGRTMYVSDAPTRTAQAFDLDPATGELSNQREFLRLGPSEGFVDGATVDAAGGYWLAAVGAGALRRYHADGTLDRVVPLPFARPTKPAFGGPDMATLYVTSTRLELQLTCAPSIGDGPIFELRPGEHGLAETPFAG